MKVLKGQLTESIVKSVNQKEVGPFIITIKVITKNSFLSNRQIIGFFSIVLLAVADANYKFIYCDYGSYGHQSDGGIFDRTTFREALDAGTLNLPNDELLPGTNSVSPYFFLGDSAFPLLPQLQKPYASDQDDESKRIYNYRL